MELICDIGFKWYIKSYCQKTGLLTISFESSKINLNYRSPLIEILDKISQNYQYDPIQCNGLQWHLPKILSSLEMQILEPVYQRVWDGVFLVQP